MDLQGHPDSALPVGSHTEAPVVCGSTACEVVSWRPRVWAHKAEALGRDPPSSGPLLLTTGCCPVSPHRDLGISCPIQPAACTGPAFPSRRHVATTCAPGSLFWAHMVFQLSLCTAVAPTWAHHHPGPTQPKGHWTAGPWVACPKHTPPPPI